MATNSKKQVKNNSGKWQVKYNDEDGEGYAEFTDEKEMRKWIRYQNSLTELGDKFDVISINKI